MTTTSPIRTLHETGVSVWLDDLSRSLLDSGTLERHIAAGLSGVTSNPTIFAAALRDSDRYDDRLDALVRDGVREPQELFFSLALQDVADAAALLRGTYDRSGRRDGYVSFECTPDVADDTDATVAQARQAWARVDAPNLMIKVPATDAGIGAIQALTAAGINVNVTLLFSARRHREAALAYQRGIAERVRRGEPVEHVRSVASVFVSRIDAKAGDRPGFDGSVAVANARLIHHQARALFDAPGWHAIAERGAHWQRPLWASTAPKSERLPELFYVRALALPGTIVTVPAKTLAALVDQGAPPPATADCGDADLELDELGAELEAEGLRSFGDAYAEVLDRLAARSRVQATAARHA
jgi:transaldolase